MSLALAALFFAVAEGAEAPRTDGTTSALSLGLRPLGLSGRYHFAIGGSRTRYSIGADMQVLPNTLGRGNDVEVGTRAGMDVGVDLDARGAPLHGTFVGFRVAGAGFRQVGKVGGDVGAGVLGGHRFRKPRGWAFVSLGVGAMAHLFTYEDGDRRFLPLPTFEVRWGRIVGE